MNIGIIDYGMGNLRSVLNAIRALGYTADIIDKPEKTVTMDRIILPGVGAFGEGMKNLRNYGWIEIIRNEVIKKGKPLLGICLGMQLLASKGTEYGLNDGLNLIPGIVRLMESEHPDFRLPHIGWNDVNFLGNSKLYDGLSECRDFYFVHSYVFVPEEKSVVTGVCNYYIDFVASIEKDNIFGVQYHPEKSHKTGLKVLVNFLEKKVG